MLTVHLMTTRPVPKLIDLILSHVAEEHLYYYRAKVTLKRNLPSVTNDATILGHVQIGTGAGYLYPRAKLPIRDKPPLETPNQPRQSLYKHAPSHICNR